jgi:hypothetical protein
MRAKKAKREFERYLKRRNTKLAEMRPSAGLDAMLGFYRDIRADDCDIDQDGDMLLFQWGTYDWGQGEHFSFDITRQLIVGPGEDEDFWQLSLTFEFPPDDTLRAVESGNRWCASPEQLEEFAAFVRSTAAYIAVANRNDANIVLDYECVG